MNTSLAKQNKPSAKPNPQFLSETPILDLFSPGIQSLIHKRGWMGMSPVDRVTSIYNFVRDEIQFGYNTSDDIPASKVLNDGYGQCNTKATLLMALLRACEIPNRIHGFTIDKALQKGAVKGIWYRLAPKNILHSWVEVQLMDKWYFLEGVILDRPYLNALQAKFRNYGASFCGYGAYTEDFINPKVDFALNNTFIQEKGINQDFGLFDTPDAFYKKHQQSLPPIKRVLYKYFVRFLMNKNVKRIREGK